MAPADDSVEATTRDDTHFKGEILVASRVIDYLSSGLYESPAACMKELVNNSYDADATIVNVFVKPDAEQIVIEDNGIGMSRDEFVRHFQRISESHKREDGDYTSLGRPKIGKIGIGFIAANELCDEMEIYSTKAGSTELLHVTINFAKMRDDVETRRREQDDFAKGDYYGEISSAEVDVHFTTVLLKEVRGEAKDLLAGATPPLAGRRNTSLYGLRPESVTKRLAQLDSWSSLDFYSQNRLGVALNVPIQYPSGWIPEEHHDKVAEFESEVAQLRFRVFYDGTELLKPVVLTGGQGRTLVRRIEFAGRHVAARGYLYAQHGVLRPEDLNGVLVRIRHAAVGDYRRDFFDFPTAEGTLFQRWISGEIWADDRLEEALNIDRRTLRETHQSYVELREWFHSVLTDFLREVRREMYSVRSTERRQERAEREVARIKNV